MFCLLLLFFSCASVKQPQPPAEITDPELVQEPPLYKLSFVAAGDNLINMTMIDSSLEEGVYNFFPVYTEVKSIIQQADIAFINQETLMAGASFRYSGYPQFNTPSSMASVLVDLGFTVINHANNHAMDMGEAGILATLDLWDSFSGIDCIGIRRTKEFTPLLVTRNNISLGFLSYTFSTNNIALPRDKPWMVSMIHRETIAAEIALLRPLCDFLVISVHWGDEYQHEPNAFQTDLAGFLAEHKVDVVVGHHPHVLQRAEYIERPDGKQMLCFYSLGNFASNQVREETILGGLMYVQFLKREDNAFIGDAGLIPLITHIEPGYTKTKVYPFYKYTAELLKGHRSHGKGGNFTMSFFNSSLAALNTKLFMYNPFTTDLQ